MPSSSPFEPDSDQAGPSNFDLPYDIDSTSYASPNKRPRSIFIALALVAMLVIVTGAFFGWRHFFGAPAILRQIDAVAAHPDDPEKPKDVPGVSDADVTMLDPQLVEKLLGDKSIEAAFNSESPRHAFALGRIAQLHDRGDDAFELLRVAADADSAPAWMYLCNYAEKGGSEYIENLIWSAKLGFTPALDEVTKIAPERVPEVHEAAAEIAEAAAEMAEAEANGDGNELMKSSELTASAVEFSFEEFHQPELLKALYEGNTKLAELKPRPPAVVPESLKPLVNQPMVTQRITTMYLCELAKEFDARSHGEVAVYLPENTPLVSYLVDADVSSVAEVRVATEEQFIFNQLGGVGAQLGGTLGALGKGLELLDEVNKGRNFWDAIPDAGKVLTFEHAEQTKWKGFLTNIEKQGKLDAQRLVTMYQLEGFTEEVSTIYQGLGKFILEPTKKEGQ